MNYIIKKLAENADFDIFNDRSKINTKKRFHFMKPTKYDPHNCEICKISCNSRTIYEAHTRGKKHLKELEKFKKSDFLCDICNLPLFNFNSWVDHIKTFDHVLKEQENFSNTIINNDAHQVLNEINVCNVCNLNCGSNVILQSHLTGSKHKKKLKLLHFEKLKEQKNIDVYCEACNISLEPELMILHRQSTKHQKALSRENKLSKPKNTMRYCVICNEKFSDIREAVDHYNTQNHENKLKSNPKNMFWCDVCKILLSDQSMFDSHLKEQRHIGNMDEVSVSFDMPATKTVDIHVKGFRHYRILNRQIITEGTYKEKLATKREKRRELRNEFKMELSKKAESNADNDNKK